MDVDSEATRTLSLVKDGKTFCFRYAPGDESALLQSLIDLAKSGDANFDWFDAAVLSHQMGEKISEELKEFTHGRAA